MGNVEKVKETIGKSEHKRLIAYTKADDDLREATRTNLLRTFTMLYYSGCRISEVLQITLGDIKHIIENRYLIIKMEKVGRERKVQFSDEAVASIQKLFAKEPLTSDNQFIILSKGNKTLNRTPTAKAFTIIVNKAIQKALGSRFTSHSYRRGILTEMASKKVNPKVMQSFIGHSSLSTTMIYVQPSDEDIREALVR